MDYLGSHNLTDPKEEINKDETTELTKAPALDCKTLTDFEENALNTVENREGLNLIRKNFPQDDTFFPGSTEAENHSHRDSQNSGQLELLNGYRSLVESYNLISKSFSRHVSLLQTPNLLEQIRELRSENEKFKQEKVALLKTVSFITEKNKAKNCLSESLLNIEKKPNFSVEKSFFPEVSNEIIDRQNSEITVLRKDIKELHVFREKFYLTENKQKELNEKLRKITSEKDQASDERNLLIEKARKTEDLLEVVKIHRDLLERKVSEISFIGEGQSDLELEKLEKRVIVLEERIKGTEDSEKYKKKCQVTKEDLRQSQLKIKHMEEELLKIKAINKDFELSIKSQSSRPCPAVLKKLIRLLQNSSRRY